MIGIRLRRAATPSLIEPSVWSNGEAAWSWFSAWLLAPGGGRELLLVP